MKLSHISWNFGGLAFPLVMAAIAIPELLRSLGQERFGVLTLAWGLIGYAGALDLGIGRATTHAVSVLRAGTHEESLKIPDVLFTAARITIVVGAIGSILMLLVMLLGANRIFENSRIDKIEIYISVFLMALALPMQALSSTYKGVNEAYLNFRSISILRVLLGVANFGLPMLIAIYSEKVYWLIGGIVFSRGLALFIYKVLAEKCISQVRKNEPGFSWEIAKNLSRFGGWFTISSVVNPVVSIADRFVIASVMSAAAVSFYVIPYEMVIQSLTIVGAITTVAFPYLSKLRVTDQKNAVRVFEKTLYAVIALMVIISALYFLCGGPVLAVWLGSEYSPEHDKVIKILAFGLASYTLGTMCIAWLHAHGKTNVTAKLNVVEFPIYLSTTYLAIRYFGVDGAAFAWVVRVTLNAVILYYLVYRLNAK